MTSIPYILITPARNEGKFIERTIQSVLSQTVLPVKWIIVSDGSTDETDAIVNKYSSQNTWLELIRVPGRRTRSFAGKVEAFNAGLARLTDTDYGAIGSLDADISFEKDYFEFLLQKLAGDPGLGLVGTPFKEGSNESYDYRFVSIEHVSGACQLFRRKCFEDIGGYVAVQGGGIDHIAVMASRMKGWKTRTLTEKICHHHREMGTAEHNLLKARFRNGVKDYRLGSYPLWQLFRMFYQMTRKPFLIGGLALAAGYFWATLRRYPKPVTREMEAFRQTEEMQRLKRFFRFRPRASAPQAVLVSNDPRID